MAIGVALLFVAPTAYRLQHLAPLPVPTPSRPCREFKVAGGCTSPCCWPKTPSRDSIGGPISLTTTFDKYLFLPIVRTYEFILPDYVEDRVPEFHRQRF